jgi:serine protease AprX
MRSGRTSYDILGRIARVAVALLKGEPMIFDFSRRPLGRLSRWPAPAAAALALMCSPPALAGDQHAAPGRPGAAVRAYVLDGELARRANDRAAAAGVTPVIVELEPGRTLPAAFDAYRHGGRLDIINGEVLSVPNRLLGNLASHPGVLRVHFDRPAAEHDYRTSLTIGATVIERALGYTGAGVGVAVIDSGIANWHDDLTARPSAAAPGGNQRVAAFVDFVNGHAAPYDDDGHGTHVAGIVAGNGYDSNGAQAGVAPEASLVVLKALDARGNGTISNIIRSFDWVLANRAAYNIRVVNLSVGAAIHESYWTDPLTIAAKRLVDAGVVVVAAAGNFGRNAQGQPQYGGIGAPANAPWVLTVGASSTSGTSSRGDDVMAGFSSRGPTYIDWSAKPDLVAPGVGTVSLAAPGSAMYTANAAQLVAGTISTAAMPYLSLSGTSMAAPVVSGTVALMLQANPSLSPNAVKAILQYTAQDYAGYDALTEGAGFLNAVGAVRLSRFYATARPGAEVPSMALWSKRLIWGNHAISGGIIDPAANAYALGTTWGVARTASGANIVWGTGCGGGCDNIVWGTSADNIVWGTASRDNIVWGTSGGDDNIVWGTVGRSDNIVWGTDCGGADCGNIVWGTVGRDNIVWGTADADDNIVWGTAGLDDDNIVWGTSGGDDNIVWGTSGGDNIVWGTAADDNIVWGTVGDDNIVWGTGDDGDNIVWGTFAGGDNIVWGTTASGVVLWDATVNGPVTWRTLRHLFARFTDEQIFAVAAALSSQGGR